MIRKARLEDGNKDLYFTNLHREQEEKTRMERYRERRVLLDTMVKIVSWEAFSNQGFLNDFIKIDK